MVIPVIFPALEMVLIALPVVALLLPVRFTVNAVIAPVPPVQLLNVLFWIVFVDDPASVLIHPAMVEVPLTVILEKLLLLLLITLPDKELATLVKSVSAPLAEALLRVNAVTIELLLTSCVPVLETATLLLIMMIAPVVFTSRFVKVLLLMFCDNVAAELMMYVCALVPATE